MKNNVHEDCAPVWLGIIGGVAILVLICVSLSLGLRWVVDINRTIKQNAALVQRVEDECYARTHLFDPCQVK